MPYISTLAREEIKEFIKIDPNTIGFILKSPGELNYIISTILLGYIEKNGISYSTYNEVIGALECAKLELVRQYLGPYEDKKIEENGDL